jgi:hypothetical protein
VAVAVAVAVGVVAVAVGVVAVADHKKISPRFPRATTSPSMSARTGQGVEVGGGETRSNTQHTRGSRSSSEAAASFLGLAAVAAAAAAGWLAFFSASFLSAASFFCSFFKALREAVEQTHQSTTATKPIVVALVDSLDREHTYFLLRG